MKRRIVTVTLAALLAAVGIVAVLLYVSKANVRAMDGIKPASVLVAKQAIPAGTPVSQASKLLVPHQIPYALSPSDAVRSISQDIANLVTNVNIPQGGMLLREMLVPKSVRTGALVIPPGELAVSMQLCLAADVAGYVKPGNQVAVYNTYTTGSNQSLQMSCNGTHQSENLRNVHTQLVFPSVTVLSVIPAQPPQSSSSGSATGLTNPGASAASQGVVYVTLIATTQAEAQMLTTLNATGLPSLGLTSGLGVNPGTAAQPFK